MKQPKNLFLLLLVASALLTLNLHCEKEKDVFEESQKNLPPFTTWGANTFGCKVNGENWVAYSDNSFPKILAQFDRTDKELSIDAVIAMEGKYEDVYVSIKNVSNTGYFKLQGNDPKNNNNASYIPISNAWNTYRTNDTLTGTVQLIKFDTVYQIASGTFQFQCTNGTQVATITEGRFDVHYSH